MIAEGLQRALGTVLLLVFLGGILAGALLYGAVCGVKWAWTHYDIVRVKS